jgi:hypothetical protein
MRIGGPQIGAQPTKVRHPAGKTPHTTTGDALRLPSGPSGGRPSRTHTCPTTLLRRPTIHGWHNAPAYPVRLLIPLHCSLPQKLSQTWNISFRYMFQTPCCERCGGLATTVKLKGHAYAQVNAHFFWDGHPPSARQSRFSRPTKSFCKTAAQSIFHFTVPRRTNRWLSTSRPDISWCSSRLPSAEREADSGYPPAISHILWSYDILTRTT